MADTKTSALSALTTLAVNDLVVVVDVSDTTMAASGSTKYITISNFFTSPIVTGTLVQTSNSAAAFESGPNGSTNPVFRLVNSTASSITGFQITGKGSGQGALLEVISSSSTERLFLRSKGVGSINFGPGSGSTDVYWAWNTNTGTYCQSAGTHHGWCSSGTNADNAPDASIVRLAPKVVAAADGATANAGWFTDAGVKRVSTQFDKTSSTTLADVTGLSANVVSGRSYTFEALLFTSSNIAGGVKAAIAGSATATSVVYEAETSSAGIPGSVGTSRAAALGTVVGDATAVTVAKIWITGTITVNAGGTLTAQFAQNVSNGAASSVLVGSWFIVKDNP